MKRASFTSFTFWLFQESEAFQTPRYKIALKG